MPELLLAPNTGTRAGQLLVLSTDVGSRAQRCGLWGAVPDADLWRAAQLVDINYDGAHDVIVASLSQVGGIPERAA